MADRYWVGGAGTWDATDTTHWSTTSGGSGGASVPTSADNVFFNSSSNTSSYSVTLGSNFVGIGSYTSITSMTTVLNVTTVTSGSLAVGNLIVISSYIFRITSFGTGSGGLGTYNCNVLYGVNGTGGAGQSCYSPAPVCADINLSGPSSGTLSWVATNSGIEIAGSITFPASGVSTSVNNFIFTGSASHTITTNSASMGQMFLCGTGTYTLGSAIVVSSYLNFSLGTFNTNNYAVTCQIFSQDSSGTRTINLGSSTVTISSSGYPVGSSSPTSVFGSNVTFNAGTSQVNFTAASCFFFSFGINKTWYNFSLTSTAINQQTNGGINLGYGTSDTPTFNNFSIAGQTSILGVAQVFLQTNITINGTFTIGAANSPIDRLMIQGKTIGTARTITAAAFAAGATDVDWRDITIAGAAGTISGTRFGNCLGCTNITFDAAKTVYWNLAGAQNWYATGWATSSGGTPAAANFPLAQDTAVFDNTGSVTGTISLQGGSTNAGWNVGSIDMSGRTSAMTLSIDTNSYPRVYGSWTNGSGTTLSGTGQITFLNRSTQTINSAGKTFTQSMVINTIGGGIQLLTNNLTFSDTLGINLTSGTIDLNNLSLSSTQFICNTSGTTCSIAFGTSGAINVTGSGSTILQIMYTTFTYTGTSRINLTYSGSTGTRSFNVNRGVNSPNIYVTAGSDIVNIALNSGYSIGGINFTGFTGSLATTANPITLYDSLTLGTGMTASGYTGTMTFAATSATKTITTNGVTVAFPIVINGSGLTITPIGALTSSSSITLTNGVFGYPSTSYALTVSSFTSAAGNGIYYGSSTWTITGSTFTLSGTPSFTSSATGHKISMTSASTKTFVGATSGGFTNTTLEQGGSGALTISGNNTFYGITNSVQPSTITVTAGSTQTVGAGGLNLNGTSGNLITLGSTTTSAFTIAKSAAGVNTCTFCSVSYMTGNTTATGGGTVLWRFLNSTNGGNNTNLTFASLYYWVGGAGTWDSTTTTNWSLSSGGSGATGPPTSADDVVFDSNSNATAYTVTMGTGAVCFNMTMSGPTTGQVTWAGTTAMNIYGNMSLSGTATNGGVNVTRTGTTTFSGTYGGLTITTNGVSITFDINFNGVGGTWSLGSAFTTSKLIDITNGTFDTSTNNYSVTTSTAFRIINSGTRALTLNGSTITCSYFNATSNTGLTFSAGTSTINMTASSVNVFLGSLTFYNVVFNSTNASGSSYAILDTATNTFNTFTFNSSSTSPSLNTLTLSGNITATTLNLNSGAAGATNRLFVKSDTIGTSRSIASATSYSSPDYCDFRDISATNSNFTFNNATVGNCGGNGGVLTFVAGKTVYWNLAGTQNWSANGWATSSGGSPAAANFPLAQDIVTFDNIGAAGTVTIDKNWNIGGVDMSNRSSAMTLATGTTTPTVYGDRWYYGTGITTTGTGAITFSRRDASTAIYGQGVTMTQAIIIDSINGGMSVVYGNLITTNSITLTRGTLNLNGDLSGGRTLTCQSFSSSGTITRTLTFGTTGQINVTGNATNIWNTSTYTNLTVTGTPTVNFTYSGSTGTRDIRGPNASGGSGTTPLVNVNITAGSDQIVLDNGIQSNYLNVNFTGFTGLFWNVNGNSIYGNLTLGTGMTTFVTIATITFRGTSGTQTLTTNGVTVNFPIVQNSPGATVQLGSSFTSGNTYTLTAGTLSANNYNVTIPSLSSSGSTTRSIVMGSETWTISGSGTAWDCSTSTNLSVTPGTSKISMTSASTKTFAGGGKSWGILNQGGAGELTISGNNTFADIQTTSLPSTITFPASGTTTVSAFTSSGTAGNLLTLQSSSAGSQFNLSKSSGTVQVDYLSLKDSNATGGAQWRAGTNSTIVSNVSGWLLLGPPTQIRASINSSGILFVPNFNQLDEVSKSINSVDNNALYSNLFDETRSLDYNGIPVAQRKTADGKLLVSGYFDETTLQ